MLPGELRPEPSEGVDSGLVIPQADKIPLGAEVGKDVEVSQELSMNPARGRQRKLASGDCSKDMAGRHWEAGMRISSAD